MSDKTFAIKGNIIWSKDPQTLNIVDDGYLVVQDGISQGVFEELPEQFADVEVKDYSGKLVMPGMTDLHLHAPQYAFRGVGGDMELLDWLNTYTFPEESKYADLEYADKAYTIFADDLKDSPTTRAVVFGTLHVPATELLMDKLEETGLKTMVGKVNMDRNNNPELDESTEESMAATKQWLADVKEKGYKNTQPILTPRFTPSCTDELMAWIGDLKEQEDLPLQSHLSENRTEGAWVKELAPWAPTYGDTYKHFKQLDGKPAIMAHCVWCPPEEVEILKETGTYVAHCPNSNAYLSSGIAPIRHYLDEGINVGLGTDIAGGPELNMFTVIEEALNDSKLRWVYVDESLKPLSLPEGFYLATVGGGSYFGKVGSFDPGYEADVLVLDDSDIKTPIDYGTEQRIERYVYNAQDGGKVEAKFVAGEQIF
ncbi:amidohydrolase family protein [Olsenella sp. YH-ols2217]|uniref:Amidohydrolase family protein n=1 Tax=Kribbibacterium absianum TaxID=3044210 RepID=A0ABT6ZHQ7_9ACTN|nr:MULTISPECIES: amidohydrolase family protein [unclassified Olsenella]MDJ1121097.1 amidohydrolase family protein [Olsenella sp. YH-ols2216]MDJ1128588.1 amidohydrolase family protein [Olsenella sp. YH-ols2217]